MGLFKKRITDDDVLFASPGSFVCPACLLPLCTRVSFCLGGEASSEEIAGGIFYLFLFFHGLNSKGIGPGAVSDVL